MKGNRATRHGRTAAGLLAAAAAPGCATAPSSPPLVALTTRPAAESVSAAVASAMRIEAAHGMPAWLARPVFATEIQVSFGGSPVLDGTMLYDHAGGRVRMDLTDGTVLVFDGRRAWVSPRAAEIQMPRFHLLTWPYFVAAPYKLRDPGSVLTPHGRHPLDGTDHVTALLTFDPGIGDTPDDWYVLYEDPETHRLVAMAYIVTYGKTPQEAEQDPHAIVYRDFEDVDGAVISTRWTFHHWTIEQGPDAPLDAGVQLTNPRFETLDEAVFARPPDAREAPLPTITQPPPNP